MKASLCLEATERLQWPRLYLLSRPRSRGRMPSPVGDCSQVLRVQGWALTRMHNLSLVLHCVTQGSGKIAEQSCKLFSDIRGRDGASNACFHS